jgi:hypothetical protein
VNRVLRTLPRILPALLLGLVGLVFGPLLLQSLGLSGPAAFGVGLVVSFGIPAVGALVILSRRRARARPEAKADARSTAPPTPQPDPDPHPATRQEDTMTVAGTWNVTISTPIGRQKGTLDLAVDGTALTGTAKVLGGIVPITDGSVEGDEMRFTITVTNPTTMDLRFHLVADDDLLGGTVVAGPMGEQKVAGERA